jgi:CTD kinase subunit beta
VPATTTAFRLPPSWTSQTLTELKIHLRERSPGTVPAPWEEEQDIPAEQDAVARPDGTVRYVWDDDQ